LINATNPDDSGHRLLDAVSPMVGFLARLSPLQSAYANISSAFETPTATELGNQPSGAAGINRDLRPQRSTTYEVGLKGVSASALQYNAALFATSVHDELIPYDVPGGGGRRFFRNAVRTSRRGLELGAGATVPADALGRLELLLARAGDLSSSAITRHVARAIDVVAHLERRSDGHRVVHEIARVDDGSATIVWTHDR